MARTWHRICWLSTHAWQFSQAEKRKPIMAESKIHAITEQAVKKLASQNPKKYGAKEHFAVLRYISCLAFEQAMKQPEADREKYFNNTLAEVYAKDTELAYASNFQKLLAKEKLLSAAEEQEYA